MAVRSVDRVKGGEVIMICLCTVIFYLHDAYLQRQVLKGLSGSFTHSLCICDYFIVIQC